AAYDLANGKYTAQDATTGQKGIVQLSSATNSTSESQAATPKAVKAA
ncbi:tail fiber protein, partial [Escherichia coli]